MPISMSARTLLLSATAALVFPAVLAAQSMLGGADAGPSNPFEELVDDKGSIIVPDNYRTDYVHIGTFAAAAEEGKRGSVEFHQVYIDPASLEEYQATGTFPDGTVIMKELQEAKSSDLTTGHISYWTGGKGWFVMIKDTEGRYPDSPLWGEGWGWALFAADDPYTPTNKDFESACIGCHTPVKATDWIHTWAYPMLDAKADFEKSSYAQ